MKAFFIFISMLIFQFTYAWTEEPDRWHGDISVYLRYTTSSVLEDSKNEVVTGLRMGGSFSFDYEVVPNLVCPGLQFDIATDPISFIQFFANSDDKRKDTNYDDDFRMKYIPIEFSARLYNSIYGAGFELRPFYGLYALCINYRESNQTYYSSFTGRGFFGVELIWGYFGLEYSYFLPGKAESFTYQDKRVYLMDKGGVSRFSLTVHLNPRTQ